MYRNAAQIQELQQPLEQGVCSPLPQVDGDRLPGKALLVGRIPFFQRCLDLLDHGRHNILSPHKSAKPPHPFLGRKEPCRIVCGKVRDIQFLGHVIRH